MNSNPGVQNVGVLAFAGTTSYPRDIRKFTNFGFVFEVTGVIATDAIFKVQAAPASAGDPCAPGAFADVPDVSICGVPATPGPAAQVTIPAGTPVGTICAGTIPCRPGAFVQLVAVSGTTANVRAVQILQGPQI